MKIALLTCERLPNLTPADQLLIPELAKHNHVAKAVVWDDPTVNWSDYDCLIFRNTWDYYEKETAFNFWLEKIQKLQIKTFNALEIIQKNKHKFYLKELQEQGIKILPTVFIHKTTDLQLSKLIPPSWEKAVIKPAFSAGSYLTEVFEVKNSDTISKKYKTIASQKEMLLQEFMPQIETLGETSLLFFNKKFSHSINKKPASGDFRVQVQFGGQYTLIQSSKAIIAIAQQIVNTFPDELLYARVDGIVIEEEFHLMEIECIEPDLYLNLGEGTLQKFVAALLELIH